MADQLDHERDDRKAPAPLDELELEISGGSA